MARQPDAVEKLSIGNGGWVQWHTSELGAAVLVRFARRDGRLIPVEIYVEGGDDAPLDTDALRRIPLGRIKEWINTPDAADAVERRMGIPGPLLSVAASHFASGFGSRAEHWVAGMLRSQIAGSPTKPAPRGAPRKPLTRPQMPSARLRLYDRDAERQSPGFYEELAALVLDLKKFTHHFKPLIADANNVTPRQVQTWVQKAQRDGLLPSKQGKAAADGER